MGTSNFAYSHRLDVLTSSCVSDDAIAAYNDGLDEEDKLAPDDYERISDIIGWQLDWECAELRARADKYKKDIKPKGCRHAFEVEGSVLRDGQSVPVEAYRSYPHSNLFCLETYTYFAEAKLYMRLYVVMRSGYYDGVNLDHGFEIDSFNAPYSLTVELDGSSEDEAGIVDYWVDSIADETDFSRAWACAQHRNLLKRAEQMQSALWQAYEDIAAPYVDGYTLVARASNGESFYEKH